MKNLTRIGEHVFEIAAGVMIAARWASTKVALYEIKNDLFSM